MSACATYTCIQTFHLIDSSHHTIRHTATASHHNEFQAASRLSNRKTKSSTHQVREPKPSTHLSAFVNPAVFHAPFVRRPATMENRPDCLLTAGTSWETILLIHRVAQSTDPYRDATADAPPDTIRRTGWNLSCCRLLPEVFIRVSRTYKTG